MGGRISKVESRGVLQSAIDMRITTAEARTIQKGRVMRGITSVHAQAIGTARPEIDPPQTGGRPTGYLWNFTSAYAQVMFLRTPNFEWIDMLIPEVFPYDISFNSIGATRFQTDVTVVDSGHDQRNSRWTQPLMEYDVAYGVRTMEHLHGLIAFFRTMQGKKHSFLYHDHTDFTSTQATELEKRKAPPISNMDQPLGTGDHKTKTFQLVKEYFSPGGQVHTRPIYKPKPGSVLVSQDGGQVLNWTLDPMKGTVEFFSRLVISNLNDMMMEKLSDTQCRMTALVVDAFTGLAPGDKIITEGWVNPLNNSNESVELFIQTINTDRNVITFSCPEIFGAVETSVDGVSVRVHPAPPAGVVLRAGFHFYVPVRFDTDRLPVSLEAYGVGGAADVKLVEVRPNAE